MGFLKYLRENIPQLPVAIANGSIYLIKASKAILMDVDGERIRLNPPADWEETDTESPSYITNKPDLGEAAFCSVATDIDDLEGVTTAQLVKTKLNEVINLVNVGNRRPESCKLKAEMVNIDKLYIYIGDEAGMRKGYWYYYDDIMSDWVPGDVYNAQAISTDTSLSIDGEAADAKTVGDAITSLTGNINRINQSLQTINDSITDIGYMPIKIENFTLTQNEAEQGEEISVGFSCQFNKIPTYVKLSALKDDGINYNVYENSSGNLKTISVQNIAGYTFKGNTVFTLLCKDSNKSESTATELLAFKYPVYYGASGNTEADNTFLTETLFKILSENNNIDLNIDAENPAQGLYIWYACPQSFGTPNFSVNGVIGGFRKSSTLSHTNSAGKSGVMYDVWRSDNPGLGQTIVHVQTN